MKAIYPTLYRDFSSVFLLRRFWLFCALLSSFCAILFFAYLEDFLSIQALLRAKNSRYGVTDLVVIPYLKITGYACIIFIASLCSKLFHNEHFSAFSQLYRSTPQSTPNLIIAKYIYVISLTLLAIFITCLPAIGSGLFFDYNGTRVTLLVFGLFMLLLSVGAIAALLSQIFSHSILAVLVTIILIILPELGTRFLVEPSWLNPIIAFFSPISHMNRIATGNIAASDATFFISLLSLTALLSSRTLSNTYFLTR